MDVPSNRFTCRDAAGRDFGSLSMATQTFGTVSIKVRVILESKSTLFGRFKSVQKRS